MDLNLEKYMTSCQEEYYHDLISITKLQSTCHYMNTNIYLVWVTLPPGIKIAGTFTKVVNIARIYLNHFIIHKSIRVISVA